MLNKTKRAQVSDTLTWIVATMIIVFVLLLFIYVSGLLGKAKNLEREIFGVNVEDDSSGGDLLEKKTEISLNKDSSNRDKIVLWINENG